MRVRDLASCESFLFAKVIRNRWIVACHLIGSMVLSASLMGCGNSSTRFIPSMSEAEAAVKASLEDWKKGLPAGPVAGTKPVVHVVDSQRRELPQLEDYQILGEVPGNAPRCLAVRLKWTKPNKEERARYIVVGIDPLWVYRQEDYDLLTHWEHPMEEPAKLKSEGPPSSDAVQKPDPQALIPAGES